MDQTGQVVDGSREEKVIAREVTLDLEREIAVTRLMPEKKALLQYRRRVDRAGLRARLSVVVYPEEFYARFFESLLTQGAGRSEAQIREALAAARLTPGDAARSRSPRGIELVVWRRAHRGTPSDLRSLAVASTGSQVPTCSKEKWGRSARSFACSIVMAQMFAARSTSMRVFSSRFLVSTTGSVLNSM